MQLTEFPEKTRTETSDYYLVQRDDTKIYSKVPCSMVPDTAFLSFPDEISVQGNSSETISKIQCICEQYFTNRTVIIVNYPGTLTFTTDSQTPVDITLSNTALWEGGFPVCITCSDISGGNGGQLTASLSENKLYLLNGYPDNAHNIYANTQLTVSYGNPVSISDLMLVFMIYCDVPELKMD